MSDKTAWTISRLEDLRRWLVLEQQAEVDRLQKESGHFRRLGQLRLTSIDDWHSGRQLAHFAAIAGQSAKFALLQGMVEEGIPVRISSSDPAVLDCLPTQGIVQEIGAISISVVVSRDWNPEGLDSFRLEPTANSWTANRTDAALASLTSQFTGRNVDDLPPALRQILNRPPSKTIKKTEWINHPQLNTGQNQALAHCLLQAPMALIQGPPGTGKTTTLATFIAFLVRSGQRVLVAAASNLAVDNLLEKVMSDGISCLRMGHPLRVHPRVREATFEALLRGSAEYTQAKKLRQEARALKSKAGKWSRAKPEPGQRKGQYAEVRALFHEADHFEDLAREKLLDDSPAIFTTLSGFVQSWPGKRMWDWLIIDEACQAMEAPVWPLLPKVKHVVFAGDPCQLPPTVLSAQAIKEGASVSLMERLAVEFPERLFLLETQYRMVPEIMEFPSVDSYQGRLIAHESVLSRATLPNGCELFGGKVIAIDTSGSDFQEEHPEQGSSLINPSEANLILRMAKELVALGLAPEHIGIITPYRAQAELIASKSDLEGLEINSVDSFQGREKEAILVSLVRSNPSAQIGFLAETRRTHVAITRARSFLGVVGDFSTLATHPYYSKLLDFWMERGFVRSVWDEEIARFLS